MRHTTLPCATQPSHLSCLSCHSGLPWCHYGLPWHHSSLSCHSDLPFPASAPLKPDLCSWRHVSYLCSTRAHAMHPSCLSALSLSLSLSSVCLGMREGGGRGGSGRGFRGWNIRWCSFVLPSSGHYVAILCDFPRPSQGKSPATSTHPVSLLNAHSKTYLNARS